MIIARLNLDAFPQCGASGWTDATEGRLWTKRLVAGAAADGRAAIQIDHLGTTNADTEYYHGKYVWRVPAVPTGQTRYLRLRLKLLPPIAWFDEGGGRFGMKFVLIGEDGANDTNRFILNLRSNLAAGGTHDPANVMLRAERNVMGPPSRVDMTRLPIGEWLDLQVRVRTGASGGIDLYLNNDDEAAPTARSSGMVSWPTDGWTVVRLGYYGESLGTRGHAAYQISAFEYADAFDPAWHSGVVNPPPPPPACTWSVLPLSLSFIAAGGEQPVLVAANREGCPWTTSGSTDWLTLDPEAGGVNVTALPNPNAVVRTATLTIAGQTVAVSQAAAVVGPPPSRQIRVTLDVDPETLAITHAVAVRAPADE